MQFLTSYRLFVSSAEWWEPPWSVPTPSSTIAWRALLCFPSQEMRSILEKRLGHYVLKTNYFLLLTRSHHRNKTQLEALGLFSYKKWEKMPSARIASSVSPPWSDQTLRAKFPSTWDEFALPIPSLIISAERKCFLLKWQETKKPFSSSKKESNNNINP